MYYFYVIQSLSNNSLYFGSTNDLKRRVKQHEQGGARYTRRRGPWRLIYYEAYLNLEKARFREWKIKHSAHEYKKLKERIL